MRWRMRLWAGLGAVLLPATTLAQGIAEGLFYEGDFHIRGDAAGDWLGTIIVEQVEFDRVIGSGEVFATPAAPDVTPFDVRLHTVTRAALGLTLTFAPETGLPVAYLLVNRIPSDDGGLLLGSLIRGPEGQQDWAPVTLGWTGAEPDEMFDAPGFGVYALPFGLRNTQGARVGLRDTPRADAALTHVLPGDVADLWVSECTPDVDGLTWESAGPAARLVLLDTVWCKVVRDNAPAMQGWVPGYFLNPL